MLEDVSLSEIILFALATASSIIGFYIKELYTRLSTVEKSLQDHRVEDAKTLVPRIELQAFGQALRDDIRGMISPLNNKVENIESYLRDSSKSNH